MSAERTAAAASFQRRFFADNDDLVAARWWQEAMRATVVFHDPEAAQNRRQMLLTMGGIGGTVLLLALSSRGSGCNDAGDDSVTMDAIEAQRSRGWDVGAKGASLYYDARSERDAAGRATWSEGLEGLVADLAPQQPALLPYYVPTLFQVLSMPDFRNGVVPIHTAAMEHGLACGRAIGDLFRGQGTQTALLIDVPGPTAVAVAAGLADVFDPIFLFDNWPHPRGVVPSHEAIAAAIYYRWLFVEARATRTGGAPPAFIIDDRRLAPYRDESGAFDNRYLARLPTADGLQQLGLRRLVYVTETAGHLEADDLNDDFVALDARGIEVKMLALSDFTPYDTDGSRVSYGGSTAARYWFWSRYWPATSMEVTRRVPPPSAPRPIAVSEGASFRPSLRPTIFSSRSIGGRVGFARAKPSGFGTVSIGRSGSLGRTSFFGGG